LWTPPLLNEDPTEDECFGVRGMAIAVEGQYAFHPPTYHTSFVSRFQARLSTIPLR